ncbi:hypothetical protein [Jiella pelagia]|uniref:Uncharacterized protein n=1 Tax=Jiella pelagia TaxID=2986949 RepID=A0ABY7BX05_9HYPH|nr:hypothetical protein [Jiella pelagia]WAP67962.1 hypothetical protein OH818_21410 [Jiella pelagia]
MSMRLTASVQQKRLRKSFRQLVEEGLGRAREANVPKRAGDLPRTSNLARTPAGRALLADPFGTDAGLGSEPPLDSRRSRKS